MDFEAHLARLKALAARRAAEVGPSFTFDPPAVPAALTPADARVVGLDGAARSAVRADGVSADWVERACARVTAYADAATEPFLLEDARAAAEADGLPKPPDGRAWGAVVTVLKSRRILTSAGPAPAKSSHGSLKFTWKRTGKP